MKWKWAEPDRGLSQVSAQRLTEQTIFLLGDLAG